MLLRHAPDLTETAECRATESFGRFADFGELSNETLQFGRLFSYLGFGESKVSRPVYD
jgi:hypothetical protein